jgi:hypothetical protein
MEVQEIAREIEDVIVRYQDEHPRTTQADIQHALQLAQSRAGKGSPAAAAVIATALGVSVMIGLLTLMLARDGEVPWIALSSVGIMMIAIVPLIMLIKQK